MTIGEFNDSLNKYLDEVSSKDKIKEGKLFKTYLYDLNAFPGESSIPLEFNYNYQDIVYDVYNKGDKLDITFVSDFLEGLYFANVSLKGRGYELYKNKIIFRDKSSGWWQSPDNFEKIFLNSDKLNILQGKNSNEQSIIHISDKVPSGYEQTSRNFPFQIFLKVKDPLNYSSFKERNSDFKNRYSKGVNKILFTNDSSLDDNWFKKFGKE